MDKSHKTASDDKWCRFAGYNVIFVTQSTYWDELQLFSGIASTHKKLTLQETVIDQFTKLCPEIFTTVTDAETVITLVASASLCTARGGKEVRGTH